MFAHTEGIEPGACVKDGPVTVSHGTGVATGNPFPGAAALPWGCHAPATSGPPEVTGVVAPCGRKGEVRFNPAANWGYGGCADGDGPTSAKETSSAWLNERVRVNASSACTSLAAPRGRS
jgi:hypothetical protein